MATKRKAIPKKTRFEVFKRDAFTCKYCGANAANVVLEIDHVVPISKGGPQTDMLNLVTSCKGCNSGKGATLLGDDSTLVAQRKQLEELQIRKEQREMMIEWRRELERLGVHTVEKLADFWIELVPGWKLNVPAQAKLKKLLRRQNVDAIMRAMSMAVDKFSEMNGEGVVEESAADKCWSYVAVFCRINAAKRCARAMSRPDIDVDGSVERQRPRGWSLRCCCWGRAVTKRVLGRSVPAGGSSATGAMSRRCHSPLDLGERAT